MIVQEYFIPVLFSRWVQMTGRLRRNCMVTVVDYIASQDQIIIRYERDGKKLSVDARDWLLHFEPQFVREDFVDA